MIAKAAPLPHRRPKSKLDEKREVTATVVLYANFYFFPRAATLLKMVIKVYISGISGNHEIRKQQQRVLFILSSLKVDFEVIDITEMGKEEERNFMRTECRRHERPNALPPQIFNDKLYCGDYNDFETATEDDKLRDFLKLDHCTSTAELSLNSGNDCKNSALSNVETGESEAVEA